ncbi:MAG: dTDP-4-dehydrorhamnose 3,5-epimerase [Rectinemataceae bacterium]|jgi:dTDP-4-dehydrorhamnose 3,5-epimerase
MPFECSPLAIPGLYAIQPKVFGDGRGYFFESYSERDFFASGLDQRFVQDNQSASSRGVLRGLHYQRTHPQGKLVRVISGRVFDVVVDLRSGSGSFGKWEAVLLSGELHNQFYVPPGFAHGFMVLSEAAVFAYKCTDFYYPEDEGGIRWDDPGIAIAWPDAGLPPMLSVKDMALPAFDPKKSYFDDLAYRQ